MTSAGGCLDPGPGGGKLRQQARTEKKKGAFAEANRYLKGLFSSTSACFFFHFLFFRHRQRALLTPSLFSSDSLPYYGLFPTQQSSVGQNIFREEGGYFHAYYMRGSFIKRAAPLDKRLPEEADNTPSDAEHHK